MPIPRSTIDAIQTRINIVDIVSSYLSLKKRGKTHIGLCPFHNEKTPSFNVNEEKGLFYCFGCKEGGNVFHFLMKYKNMTFYEVVLELGKSLNIKIKSETSDKHSSLLRIFKHSAEIYSKVLRTSNSAIRARSYLSGRHIKKGIDIFNIGYAPPDRRFLSKELNRFNLKDVLNTSLVKRGNNNSQYDYFSNRIIFPIYDDYDRVIAFGARLIDDGQVKYLNSPENYFFKKRETLYGLNRAKEAIKKEGFVVVVEGYFDVILAFELGIENVVSPLGTSLTEGHINKIKRYCKRIILAFDGDTGGEQAIKRSITHSLNAGLDSYVFPMSKGKDPYDYLLSFGKDAFLKGLENAIEGLDYYIRWEFKRKECTYDYQKRDYLNTIYNFLHLLDSEVQKEQCFKKLSSILNLSSLAIQKDFIKSKSPHRKKKDEIPIHITKTPDIYLIFIILNNVELFKQYKTRIPFELFKDELAKKLFLNIKELYEKENQINIDDLLRQIENTEEKSIVLEALTSDEYSTKEPIGIIEDCINKIKQKDITEKNALLSKKIKAVEKGEDSTDINILLEEKQFLINEENKLRKKENAI